ncbi:TRAP transporter substrate-binding protein [Methanotrichaceae archaeon M04Ac]|jgi:TRAP-type C4-dicarboxylate transport system substrate-binding protein|uniref:TRAP transporter substrate-binding protein n=1 Tax=Candidatus Methanocrinis alkalitolerans TaxID=3033395 RepID=A0ABT5XFL0_9EURY|nr:TRAP transporter substrate-binding protein [Candidatus Methanocrinis alkalitolerans]MCR3884567.1 TRAP transporter substrate-binding protein [Methanothrix sp.]MDF0593493.1 TRAP transporter substrate-binding protein [Candidatus Methanocrinis alkalitolerans]
MKRRYALTLASSVLLASLFVATSIDETIPQIFPSSISPSPGEALQINFSTWHLHDSPEVQTVWIPVLQALEEKSGGRISWTLFDGGALGSGPEHYDLVADGRSDMGYATLTWTPGRFPISDVLSLPASIEDKETATDIGRAVYERALRGEFADVLVLEVNPCVNSHLWTKEPVVTLEDAGGLRIRSPGGLQTRCIEAIGAVPVFMPLDSVRKAMEEGTIDGVVTCPSMVRSFGLAGVADHCTLISFGCVGEGLFMNLEAWETAPADLRRIIEEVCANPYRTTGAMTGETYQEIVADLDQSGVVFTTPSPEEMVRWHAAFQNVTRGWVAELEAEGLPARQTVEIFREECEENGVSFVAFPPEWR